MPPTTDPITRLFRACEPEELKPGDPRYVNLDEVRGENLPLLYERAIRRADPVKPEVKIFAGHLGVGKTSELLRLKAMLESPDSGKKPFLVIFSNVSNVLDLNDLDFPDLLVFLAAQVQEQLAKAKIPGFSSTSSLLDTVWDELKSRLLPEASLTGIDVEVPFVSLAVELKNRPNSRGLLRAEIEKQSTSLLDAVNDLLTTATVRLRQNGWEGLVLIVDGLDKLVRRDLDDGKSNTHERLFVHRSQQLASLKAHVIYTVPISLIYSPLFTQIEQIFGEHQTPVPMIRLRDGKRAKPAPGTPGMRKMKEILEARCQYAQVDLGDVFDSPDTCHHLCQMTGGHPRHLMIFLQAAISRVDALPVTRAAVDKAIGAYANSLLRQIPDEFWPDLQRFDQPQDDIPRDERHQMMLLLLYVFEYMNGHPWYEVNPVLRALSKLGA